MGIQVLLKRGPTSDRLTYTPAPGEIILDLDETMVYIGDGETPGGILLKNCDRFAEKIRDGDLKLTKESRVGREQLTNIFSIEDFEELI